MKKIIFFIIIFSAFPIWILWGLMNQQFEPEDAKLIWSPLFIILLGTCYGRYGVEALEKKGLNFLSIAIKWSRLFIGCYMFYIFYQLFTEKYIHPYLHP